MFRGALFFAVGMTFALAAGWYGWPRAIYRQTAQPLQFSHQVHAEKAGMKCEDCHTLLADGSFSGIPVVDKCAGCHAAPAGTTADEKLLVEKYVTSGRNVPWGVYSRQPDNAWFPHAVHVNLAKLRCEQCHDQHGKSDKLQQVSLNRITGYSKSTIKMSRCEACHAERGVKAGCLDCHK